MDMNGLFIHTFYHLTSIHVAMDHQFGSVVEWISWIIDDN